MTTGTFEKWVGATFSTLVMALWLVRPVAGQLDISESVPKRLSDPEVGLPFVTEHFAPQDYRQQPSNWDIVQDDRGLIYVANNDGILQYDGTSWRFIPTVTNTIVRSLAVGPNGTIYAGAQGDFGYLQPDSTGTLEYVSLIDEVPEEEQSFKDVWSTHSTREGVYFQTWSQIYYWNGSDIQVLKPRGDNIFHTSFVVDEGFYVREHGRGLLVHNGGNLDVVSQGERFSETQIFTMLPHRDRIIVGTREEDFFYFNGQIFEPFDTEADAYLDRHPLYAGYPLPHELFALATKGGGVVVMNADGEVVQILDRETGLPDEVVNAVFADAQGGLWMGFNNSGLMRTDVTAPLSAYESGLGLEGIVWDMARHDGMFYVATGAGLYRLEHPAKRSQDERQARFRRIAGVALPHGLVSTEHGLIVATENGGYLLQGGESQKIIDRTTFTLRKSEFNPNRVYAGLKHGLAALEHTDTGWQHTHFDGFSEEVRSIVETAEDTLWVGTKRERVLRVSLHGRSIRVKEFDAEKGLPDEFVRLASLSGDIVAFSKKGIYQLDENAEGERRFYPHRALVSPPAPDSLLSFYGTRDGNAWIVYPDLIEIARLQSDSSYTVETPRSLYFSRSQGQQRIYVETDGVAWIADRDRIIRYDSRLPEPPPPAFPPLVRQITTLDGEHIVFGGNQSREKRLAASGPELDYDYNDLRIEYVRPEYNPLLETEYQYRLEGRDEDWSEWTNETALTYTNLREGSYQFRVRARTEGSAVSRAASYSFRVLPPWYRTWKAYGAYALLLALSVLAGRHYRRVLAESRRVREQARELERERRARKRLKEANRSLRQANEFKEELLATTSHELRTPVTAILGFTSILEEELPEHYHEFLNYIELNGKRLQETVDSLLDLAKLRAGMMKVKRERFDLRTGAEDAVQMYRPLAEQKDINLKVERPDRPLIVDLDRGHLNRILNNLLDNAIKFTESGGVAVVLKRSGNQAQIEVHDTGVGIAEEFLPHLFEEFKQESTGLARSHEGSGLGLTVTSRLVELMGGQISVESQKGHGTVFVISFPLSEVGVGAAMLV